MNEEINVLVCTRPDVKSIFSQVPTGVDPSISRATHSAAARRPHPASLPAGALPTPQSRLIPSPPPHPQAPNRLFSLTLATGLTTGAENDGPRSRAVRLASGWGSPLIYRPWEPLLVHGIKDCSWPSPSPAVCKVAAARELRHAAGVFAGSPDDREPLDASVSAGIWRPSAYAAVQQDLVDLHQGILFPGISEHSPMGFFSSWLLIQLASEVQYLGSIASWAACPTQHNPLYFFPQYNELCQCQSVLVDE
jgi:hypothetical protein